MLLKSVVALLGAAALSTANPTVDERSVARAEQQPSASHGGIEVVIVYATPQGGCPAKPSQCPFTLPAPSPSVCSSDSDDKSKESGQPEKPTAAYTHSAPLTTLEPAVHWDWDTAPAANIIPIAPQNGSPLYYGSGDPSQSGYYAFVTYYFNTPSVNLDHCDHVTKIVYTDGTELVISFGSTEAYQYAVQHWSTSEGLILVAYVEGCGDYSKGERCYFQVSGLQFRDGLVVVAQGSVNHPDNVISKGETEWGWWVPRNGGVEGTQKSSQFGWGNWASNTSSTGSSASSSTSSASGTSTGTPSLDTDSFAAARSACNPPTDTKYGLPTACLGDYFDDDLDDALGYESPNPENQAFISEIAPGIDDYDVPTDTDLARRALVARGCRWCSSLVKAFNDHVVQPAKNGYRALQQATSISGSINKDLSWKLPDSSNSNPEAKTLKDPNTKQVTSPWGDAVLLKTFGSPDAANDKKLSGYMNVYCVSCGVSGRATVAGKASWTPVGGFITGQVDIRTDAQFVFKLGVDAQMTYQQDFKNSLLDLGLPGLSYGVVTIGPRIAVGTNVALEAQAKGRLLAGAEMGLQGAHVLIDFINPGNSQKDGWEPYFKPVFEAEGELMLSASLGLPIGIKCGLQISKWDKSVGIIDEPSIKGVAQVAASVGLTNGKFAAGFKETNGCTGISTQISWRNRLYIDIFGTSQIPLLDTNDRPLTQGCINLPAAPKPSTTTDTATVTTVPTTTATEASTTTTTTTTLATDTDTDAAPTTTPTTTTATTTDDEQPSTTTTSASETGTVTETDTPTTTTTTTTDTATNSAADPTISEARKKRGDSVSLSNIWTRDTPSNGTVIDLTSKVQSTSTDLTYDPAPLPNIPYNSTKGYEFSLLVTPDASTMVVSCGNGNLYAVSTLGGEDNPLCSEMWAEYTDVLIADGAERLLHYYDNTMSKLGVSRLRVEDEDTMPSTGVIVAMVPYYLIVNDGGGDDGDNATPKRRQVSRRDTTPESDIYYAVDPDYNIFYPFVCDYKDPSAASKIFLAKDPVAGVEILQSLDVQYSITGGEVAACYQLSLTQGQWDDSDGGYDKLSTITDAQADSLTFEDGWDE